MDRRYSTNIIDHLRAELWIKSTSSVNLYMSPLPHRYRTFFFYNVKQENYNKNEIYSENVNKRWNLQSDVSQAECKLREKRASPFYENIDKCYKTSLLLLKLFNIIQTKLNQNRTNQTVLFMLPNSSKPLIGHLPPLHYNFQKPNSFLCHCGSC